MTTHTHNTIISHIIGGLGNQMFQYAAGRALSLQRDQSLLLDVSDFATYSLHQGFELQRVFVCPAAVANAKDIRTVLGWQTHSFFKNRLMSPRWARFRSDRFVIEPHFQYWSGIQSIPLSSYLLGYWQTERYFEDIVDIIRADFAFKLPLNAKNLALAQQISEVNAVSLHVRRGDYVQNPAAFVVHGLCSLSYYREAIQSIANKVKQPYFFVFSDDMAWVKENLSIPFPCQYVAHNQGMDSYNDMRLMSLCQHHIIANSSFSWWGAWLNPNINKTVIAPKQWFAGNKDTRDLLPAAWIKL
jgi:hypothetical protein